MKETFAFIYETVFPIYKPEFFLVFQTLYDYGGYTYLGLTFLITPLIMFGGFYFLWKYPYGTIWHWVSWLVIIILTTGGITWSIANNEIFLSDNQALLDALADPDSGYEEFANTLPLKYALVNGLLSLIVGFVYSIIFKQFSKIQIHLPF